jgi:hypothetical protein
MGPGQPLCKDVRKDKPDGILDYSPCFDEYYSRGIRAALFDRYEGDDEIVFVGDENRLSPETFTASMARSHFCLCILGYALWSPRLVEATTAGCIPVIIADGIELPFEGVLDYRRFAVKVSQSQALLPADDPKSLKSILRGISLAERERMKANLDIVASLFRYPRKLVDGMTAWGSEDHSISAVVKIAESGPWHGQDLGLLDVLIFELWVRLKGAAPVAFSTFPRFTP